jgi:hypothetical protein
MSIGSDSFAAHGLFQTFDPHAVAITRVDIHQTQCRSCGYEPENQLTPPKVCPKCRSQHWERFTLPGSILKNSARY